MHADTALVLLDQVNIACESLLCEIRSARSPVARQHLIGSLQHLGVVKHRLEYGLDFPHPFAGPEEWGFPREGYCSGRPRRF